ncbi:MAG TPA: hypothetical protein VII56_19180 [Rhizomicrobium sp.]
MPTTTIAQQAEEYGGFYVPRFEVRAQGAALGESVIRDVTQVTYKDDIKAIDSFTLTVGNWDSHSRRFKYIGSEDASSLSAASPEAQRYKLFEPGARNFTLSMGYGSQMTQMTVAGVTTMEPTFPASGASTLSVRALNVLHLLRDKPNTKNWIGKRESDIAKDLKSFAGSSAPKVRISPSALAAELPIDYVAQDGQYDIDFLFGRARIAGYVVYVGTDTVGGKSTEYIYFGPSNDQHPGPRDVTYELKWGISLVDFKPTLNTANQVKAVQINGGNRQTNKTFVGEANASDARINEDLIALLSRTEIITDEPHFTKEEADRRARAVLSDRLKEMVTAQGTCIGLPFLRAGRRVMIKGVGSRFSGTYFVTETTHTIDDSGYSTKFTARREQPVGGS